MKGWGFHKSTWKDRDTCQLRPLKGLTDTSYSWRQENFLVWWFIRIQMTVHLQGFRVLKLVCERGTIWYYKVKRYLFCLKWCIKGWAVEPRGEAFSYKLFLSTPPPPPPPLPHALWYCNCFERTIISLRSPGCAPIFISLSTARRNLTETAPRKSQVVDFVSREPQ